MKKLISLFLVLSLLTPATAFTKTEFDKSLDVMKNLLPNPGFEAGKAGCTNSGGTFITEANTSGGGLHAKFTATASGQYFECNSLSIPDVLQGQNGLGYFHLISSIGWKIQVYQGATLLSERDVSASSSYQRWGVNFIFPASGTVKLRVTSTGAGSVQADDGYVGSATNLVEVSQAEFVGSVSIGNCTNYWSMSSATFADFPAASGCTVTAKGSISADGMKPAAVLSNPKSGNYRVVFSGELMKAATGGTTAYFRLTDGASHSPTTTVTVRNVTTDETTASSVMEGQFTYENPSGPITWKAQGATSTGAIARIAGIAYGAGGEMRANMLSISVYRFPLQSELAMRADQIGQSWSGRLDGGSCSWTYNSTSQGDPTGASGCSVSTISNSNLGSVTQNGSTPGFSFNLGAGKYWACMSGRARTSGVAGSAIYTYLVDDANTTLGAQKADVPGTGYDASYHVCGILSVAGTGTKSLRIQSAVTSGTATYQNGGGGLQLSIVKISDSVPAPVFIKPTPVYWTAKSSLSGKTSALYPLMGGMGSLTGSLSNVKSSGGLTCSADTTWLGINCTFPSTGSYRFCMNGGLTRTSGAAGNTVTYALYAIGDEEVIPSNSAAYVGANALMWMGGCYIYNVTSLTNTFLIKAGSDAVIEAKAMPTSFMIEKIQ